MKNLLFLFAILITACADPEVEPLPCADIDGDVVLATDHFQVTNDGEFHVVNFEEIKDPQDLHSNGFVQAVTDIDVTIMLCCQSDGFNFLEIVKRSDTSTGATSESDEALFSGGISIEETELTNKEGITFHLEPGEKIFVRLKTNGFPRAVIFYRLAITIQ